MTKTKNNTKNRKGYTMDDLKKFITNYWGAVLGGIIALILACTNLYRIVVGIVLIAVGIWAGNYFQHYKENVKNKLKNFIDKM